MAFSRYCLLFVFAFLLSLAFCKLLIPLLRKIGAGQNILSYVKEHEQKNGDRYTADDRGVKVAYPAEEAKLFVSIAKVLCDSDERTDDNAYHKRAERYYEGIYKTVDKPLVSVALYKRLL